MPKVAWFMMGGATSNRRTTHLAPWFCGRKHKLSTTMRPGLGEALRLPIRVCTPQVWYEHHSAAAIPPTFSAHVQVMRAPLPSGRETRGAPRRRGGWTGRSGGRLSLRSLLRHQQTETVEPGARFRLILCGPGSRAGT